MATDYHGGSWDLEPDDYYALRYDEIPSSDEDEPDDTEEWKQPLCMACFDTAVDVEGEVCDSCNDHAAEKRARLA